VTGLSVRRTGALLCERLERADTWRARLVGLLGRDGLAPGEGLLLDPCNSVHTFFMRFTIDVAFLDAAGAVVAICPRLRPWRATRVHLRARRTLELPAGALEAAAVAVGDVLVEAPAGPRASALPRTV
jgi:uncharacterized membrane protein (UPF0127 family)